MENENKKISKQEYEKIILEDLEGNLFLSEKEGYARVVINGKYKNIPVRSGEFEDYARYKVYRKTSSSISVHILKEIISLVGARAQFSEVVHRLFHRVGLSSDDKVIAYNLCDKDGHYVRIEGCGWEVCPNSKIPLAFKEPYSKPQVTPLKGGGLKDIFEILNIRDRDVQLLYLCVLCTSMIPGIPHPIVYVHGPAGSGKTNLLKITKDLLDPCEIGVGGFPKNIEDYLIQLDQQWVAAFDNVGKINDEWSDAMARTCTGDTAVKRTLYENKKLTLLKAKNPVFLNGINMNARKSDLLQRSIMIETSVFKDGDRKSEAEINKKYKEMKPRLLGAIFSAVSEAMSIKTEQLPITDFRLADFANWGSACAIALGYSREDFIRAYSDNSKRRAQDAIRSSNAGTVLIHYLEVYKSFVGLTSELFAALGEHKRARNIEVGIIAHSAQTLGNKLIELDNSLREIGIKINKKHTSKGTLLEIYKS